MTTSQDQFQISCHDSRRPIDATLGRISAAGCELVSREVSVLPVFPSRARVILSVYCAVKELTETVPVRLMGVLRINGRWTYKVSWERRPEVFGQFLPTAHE